MIYLCIRTNCKNQVVNNDYFNVLCSYHYSLCDKCDILEKINNNRFCGICVDKCYCIDCNKKKPLDNNFCNKHQERKLYTKSSKKNFYILHCMYKNESYYKYESEHNK